MDYLHIDLIHMDYLKDPNIKIKHVDTDLLNLIYFINEDCTINIFKSNVLEVGIGIGIGLSSIKLAQLFDNYCGLEPNKDIYEICKKNLSKYKSNIKLLNINFENFAKIVNLKFDLIIFENSIHLIEFDNFICSVKNILQQRQDQEQEQEQEQDQDHDQDHELRSEYVIIKNHRAIPYGWGNKELCKDSDKFNENKWIKFREKLKTLYNKLNNSPYLLKKTKNDFFHYYLLKL